MIPVNNERYEFECYKRKKDTSYEYEKAPSFSFYGRPANTLERKNYRIMKGINGNSDSQFIFSTNLPETVDIGDQILYLGKLWKVQSVGFYFDASRIINPSAFSDKELADKCPKGINIQ